ncbi:ABC transporter [Sinomonas terrae]|uniref:ABC transporter n=1 Tax=Sinomonas terrae TaxID=2908838 RepID=A0ABS9TX51_9MICC|nr:ABC transporter [Sinomonas terrae]MCH6468945.1 ABC transporter [Sinomonas terrae]
MNRRLAPVLAALVLTAASACSNTAPSAEVSPSSGTPSGSGHGAVTGAAEVAEPQLHLVAIDQTGNVGMLNLLENKETKIGTVGAPSAVATDGRYVFATTSKGVEILDGGTWTWDHGDHFHYYRAAPALLGTVPGGGAPAVSTGMVSTAGGTGLFFPESGDAVLLDNASLSRGEIRERFRAQLSPHQGLVVPVGEGAIVTTPDAEGRPAALQYHDAGGKPVEGARADCPEARGSVVTRVGAVVGCGDGALVITTQDDAPAFEKIPYPNGASASAAVKFDARKGRPTVAGVGGPTGVWLLSTRQRSWQWLPTPVPMVHASAVDDQKGHVVTLDAEGRVHVYLAKTGEEVGVTEPLLPKTLSTSPSLDSVSLTVDAQRAYVNAPSEAVVYEIDFADSARIARTLLPSVQPAFIAETGR